MVKIKIACLFISLIALISCNSDTSGLLLILKSGKVKESVLHDKPSLRGVFVLNGKVAWVSGSKSTYARTTDGGNSWQTGKVCNDSLIDFRDIHAFSSESAIVASAGSPARFYKTTNGGKTWKLTYENRDSSIFINSIDFYSSSNGYAFSDPIKRRFFVIKTSDGGETWDTITPESLPAPLTAEAGFAASGTSIISKDDGFVAFVTGGSKARIIRSKDYGITWEATETPIKTSGSAYGIYSIGSGSQETLIVAGGCWQKPDEGVDNLAISFDSGTTWNLTATFPSGFRSSVKYLTLSKAIITCGTNGVDLSENMGKTWMKLPLNGYNAMDVSSSEDLIVLVGSNGRIASSKN